MTIATWAANLTKRDAYWRVAMPPLHREIEVNSGAATVASDRQPIVFARERGGNRRPAQRDLPGRKSRIELLNGRQRIRRVPNRGPCFAECRGLCPCADCSPLLVLESLGYLPKALAHKMKRPPR
jgi:hypothetical protein